jgi:hypothetical protein
MQCNKEKTIEQEQLENTKKSEKLGHNEAHAIRLMNSLHHMMNDTDPATSSGAKSGFVDLLTRNTMSSLSTSPATIPLESRTDTPFGLCCASKDCGMSDQHLERQSLILPMETSPNITVSCAMVYTMAALW